jgi:hypothetical protein
LPKQRLPLNLSYHEACLDENDGVECEKYLKTYLGKNVFEVEAQILFNRVKGSQGAWAGIFLQISMKRR